MSVQERDNNTLLWCIDFFMETLFVTVIVFTLSNKDFSASFSVRRDRFKVPPILGTS